MAEDALDDALDTLRDGMGSGGSTGGAPDEPVDDSEPDRDRSDAPRWLCGVPGLEDMAAAALALSRREASSCLLLSPGGMIRTEASMRLCGGERLDSLLAGGVASGVGSVNGTDLGTLFSGTEGLYVVEGSV